MSTAWSDGYVSEINYTFGFYRELAPSYLRLTTLLRNQDSPSPDMPLAYCELGCGQGYGTNILAAANPGIQFVANDFNPSQVAGAQAMARQAGLTNVRFLEDSFAELVARADLPAFDIIVLHGIYSWISTENRKHIVEFIRRRLKPGGLVYTSYNTLPGWAPIMPLRRLLVDEADYQGGAPIIDRIEKALAAASELTAANCRYFAAYPALLDRLNRVKGQPRPYLAHEYFNRDWTPFYFADVVSELSAAKLSWIAPASVADAIPMLCLTGEQQKLLADVKSPVRREGLRDYLLNQQFRKDVFVKGAHEISVVEADQLWRNTRFVLTVPKDKAVLKVMMPVGEVNLQEDIYKPLIERMAVAATRGADLLVMMRHFPAAHVIQAVNVLVAIGHALPCLPEEGEAARKVQTDRFNQVILRRAMQSGDLVCLASPVTGSGFVMDRIQMMFLHTVVNGDTDPVTTVWMALEAAQQRLMRDGKPLASAEENRAALVGVFEEFKQVQLPPFRSQGLV